MSLMEHVAHMGKTRNA